MSRRAINILSLLAIVAGTVAIVPVFAQSDGAKRSAEFPVKGLINERINQNIVTQPSVGDKTAILGARHLVPADMSKGRVEMPVRSLLFDKFKQPAEATKARSVVAPDSVAVPVPPPAELRLKAPAKAVGSSQKPSLKNRNEKVEPGKVRWHKMVQTAMDASKQSGKPVLLFQMMGHLDDRFC
ncbi:MAG: hypothetical protein DKT66_22570 [Candidatus Melainabacteria bacterium]|nr:MAG: hypothetical protein DKT66_22570 [Candidatus Melainabacteria bacterium]